FGGGRVGHGAGIPLLGGCGAGIFENSGLENAHCPTRFPGGKRVALRSFGRDPENLNFPCRFL
ncbi:hypothetical protein, partial [Roseovarius indicus]|uniref:hypothetical protein n=1 Tax=Roseovarius indicus TaxID=540747 RepID=UPI001F488D3B